MYRQEMDIKSKLRMIRPAAAKSGRVASLEVAEGTSAGTWPRVRGRLTKQLSTTRTLFAPLCRPGKLDDYLELLDPCWSLDEIRARVIAIQPESADITSLFLLPNENWPGHQAGQHSLLTVEIDGVRHCRPFSLSRAPKAGSLLRMSIKAHADGCVSRWARDRARVGDVVRLSPPAGVFTLPDSCPDSLLFVSGGSGVTPLLAMAQQLILSEYRGDLLWIHSDRDVAPWKQQLCQLAAALAHGTLHIHQSGAPPAGRLDAARLLELVPDFRQREAFMCGPPGLMAEVESLYSSGGQIARLHREDYQARFAPLVQQVVADGAAGHLYFARSRMTVDARSNVSLLEQAEQAGLYPAYGCRQGICHTCKCTKRAGLVRNQLTGVINDARDEEIQLCVHAPVGDVTLDL